MAAYGRILPTAVLNLPRFGCLNLHPSLLPAYRGPSPVVGALLAGDDTTGVTLMLMDEGMDTGPIIAQRTRVVAPDDDAVSLTAALFTDGSDLLLQNLGDWMAGAIKPHPQDDARATYTTKIERADGAVDWELPAEVLARRRRAYATLARAIYALGRQGAEIAGCCRRCDNRSRARFGGQRRRY